MGWGGRQVGNQMEAETKQDSKSHSKTWSHEAWTQILAVLGDLSRKVSFIFSLVFLFSVLVLDSFYYYVFKFGDFFSCNI